MSYADHLRYLAFMTFKCEAVAVSGAGRIHIVEVLTPALNPRLLE
jgi:hypothetical protein